MQRIGYISNESQTGCWGCPGISKSKASLLLPGRGTWGGGSVTEPQGPGPSTGNRITVGQPCANQSHGWAARPWSKEREGEEYSGFCLPLALKLPARTSHWPFILMNHEPERIACNSQPSRGRVGNGARALRPSQPWSVGWINIWLTNVGRCCYDEYKTNSFKWGSKLMVEAFFSLWIYSTGTTTYDLGIWVFLLTWKGNYY